MSLEPTSEQIIETLQSEVKHLKRLSELYEKVLNHQNKQRSWKFVCRDGYFYCQPQFDLKVGDSAWPFGDGEYVLLKEITPYKGE